MTAYIITRELVALETESSELEGRELLTRLNSILECEGLEPWHSVQAEALCLGKGELIFLRPIRVFIPKILELL